MATKGGRLDAMFHLIFILYGRIIITTLFPLMKTNLVILPTNDKKLFLFIPQLRSGSFFLYKNPVSHRLYLYILRFLIESLQCFSLFSTSLFHTPTQIDLCNKTFYCTSNVFFFDILPALSSNILQILTCKLLIARPCFIYQLIVTKKHSSRMRTPACWPWGACPRWNGPRGTSPGTQIHTSRTQRQTPPSCRQTDTCENITRLYPKLRLQAVIIVSKSINFCMGHLPRKFWMKKEPRNFWNVKAQFCPLYIQQCFDLCRKYAFTQTEIFMEESR